MGGVPMQPPLPGMLPPQSQQLPPQMFTTAAQLLDLTDSKTRLPNLGIQLEPKLEAVATRVPEIH